MYNCYQNTRNSSCGNRCGGCCGQNTCWRNTCGWNTVGTVTNTNENTVTTNGCFNFGCHQRYLSFPVSGTAYVPTSAIYFCANSFGTTCTNNGNTTTNGNNGGCGGCCGFGRCGGVRAYANFNDDYYARQYGLND